MTPEQMATMVHGKERKALKALMRVYGDDVSAILNGIHAIGARIAIGTGVEPNTYAQGLKYHWDFIAAEINRVADDLRRQAKN